MAGRGRNQDQDPDLPWVCHCCLRSLTPTTGISLVDDGELNVCRPCWKALTPAERLEAVRRWRLAARMAKALEEAAALMAGARDGYHLGGLGQAGRN